MEKTGVKEYKEKISKEVDSILQYVSSFEVHSAKDLQALAEIQSMLEGVNATLVKIEESHQRRIALTQELTRALSEIETESSKFADKHKNKVSE
jgi:hypothetical protein